MRIFLIFLLFTFCVQLTGQGKFEILEWTLVERLREYAPEDTLFYQLPERNCYQSLDSVRFSLRPDVNRSGSVGWLLSSLRATDSLKIRYVLRIEPQLNFYPQSNLDPGFIDAINGPDFSCPLGDYQRPFPSRRERKSPRFKQKDDLFLLAEVVQHYYHTYFEHYSDFQYISIGYSRKDKRARREWKKYDNYILDLHAGLLANGFKTRLSSVRKMRLGSEDRIVPEVYLNGKWVSIDILVSPLSWDQVRIPAIGYKTIRLGDEFVREACAVRTTAGNVEPFRMTTHLIDELYRDFARFKSHKIDTLTNEALEVISDLIERYPDNITLLGEKAMLLTDFGLPQEGLTYLQGALRLATTNYEKSVAYFMLARYHCRLGEYTPFYKALTKAQEMAWLNRYRVRQLVNRSQFADDIPLGQLLARMELISYFEKSIIYNLLIDRVDR